MPVSRREPVQQLGILLASTTRAHRTSQPEQDDPAYRRLRVCWSSLDQLGKQSQEDDRLAKQAGEQLNAEHRAALDDLVKAKKLTRAAAEHAQSIFEAAVFHVWRWNAPITCYLAGPPYTLSWQLSTDLLRLQSESLQEIASSGEIAQETLLGVRRAIEQEMVSLGHPGSPEAEAPPELAQATRFLTQLLLQ